jgi:ribosomal protein S18 acetylase RimI-like enzyme
MNVEMRLLREGGEAEACAGMMAASEPWVTLRRGYQESLSVVSDPSREVYVAVIDGRITGFVVVEMRGAFTGYIKSICVAPDLRGRGIGARLMAYAEKRIFGETPNVFLCVSDFNDGARRFYQGLGYETVGELRDYLVRGSSEILMRKTIGPLSEDHSVGPPITSKGKRVKNR